MGSEAHCQENTTSISPHQTLHPFTQLSFWGKVSTHDSCEEFMCNPQIPPLCCRLKLIPWFFGYMVVNIGSKNPKVRRILLSPRESLLQCTHTKNPMKTPVLQIDCCVACLIQQMHKYALVMQQIPCNSHNAMIISLIHPILFWVVGCCHLSSNAFFHN